MINIQGLNKSHVLRELYNNSKVQGLGIFQVKDLPMTTEEAEELLVNQNYFDYLHGKVMKISLLGDIGFEELLYDRDNGKGKAQKIIDDLRESSPKYPEYDFSSNDLDGCFAELMKYRDDGKQVCFNFNGNMLYSDTETLDSAYLKVTNMTKAGFDKYKQQQALEYKQQIEEHEAKIPELTKAMIEKGHKLLSESLWEEWDSIVPIRLKDLYQGMELGQCLDLVQLLEEEDGFNKAKALIESQGHSGMSFGLISCMVEAFSPKGKEFIKFLENR